jgi:cytochrome c oxidase assembly factor CtaG
MSWSELLAAGYFFIGLLLYIYVILSDAKKEKVSFVNFMGGIFSDYSIAIILFIALWPFWLIIYFISDNNE